MEHDQKSIIAALRRADEFLTDMRTHWFPTGSASNQDALRKSAAAEHEAIASALRGERVWAPVPAHIIKHLNRLEYSSPVCVLYQCGVGGSGMLYVIGDPDNGGYEWVIENDQKQVKFSNVGYGDSTIALRDGLIEWHGQQEKVRQILEAAEKSAVTITPVLTNEKMRVAPAGE